MVHKMSLGILTINSIVLGTFALLLFSAVCAICGGDCIAALLVLCFPCIIIIVLFSGLANFVIWEWNSKRPNCVLHRDASWENTNVPTL